MFEISANVMTAFGAEHWKVVRNELTALIIKVAPDLPRSISADELVRRIESGMRVAQACDVTSNRDLMLVSLAHALLGADILSQQNFAWLADLLAEPSGDSDTRIFRMHSRLSEMKSPTDA